MTRADEARRLAGIRARLAALDGARWTLAADGDAMLLEASGRDGSLVTLARFSGHATQDEIETVAAAPGDIAFLLGLVERAISFASRAAPRPADAGPPAGRETARGVRSDAAAREAKTQKNHAAEAAMLCGSPAFKRFLIERHGLESPATDERAAQKLRSLLGVTSRRAINDDEAARARWLDLRRDFNVWKGRAVA